MMDIFLGNSPEPLRNVNSEILHDALKVLSQQILLHHHQKTQRHLALALENGHKSSLRNLKYGVDALEHEDIEDPEDKEEGELGWEEGEEPLAGVHVGLQAHMLEMLKNHFHKVIAFRY